MTLSCMLIIGTVSFASAMHPMHISYTNIDYNEDKMEMSVVIKLFIVDFQRIIEMTQGVKLNLDKSEKDDNSDHYISKYINSNFFLNDETGTKTIHGVMTGKKIQQESIWLYYSMKFEKKPSKIQINNTLMYELFSDQINLIIFSRDDIQKGFSLRYNEQSISIDI